MTMKKWHCKAISAVPSIASTGIQIKYQYLGDFLVELENMRRSLAWGITYPKGGGTTTT